MDSLLAKFVLVVHVMLAAGLVGVVLMQRSEGGVLGVGGGSGGFMTARGASDLLTRVTQIIAGLFICTSITLAALGAGAGHAKTEIEKALEVQTKAPAKAAPTLPQVPTVPGVPAAQ